MTTSYDRVIRKQADKLNDYLGMPPGTFISEADIERLSLAQLGEVISINGKDITITMHVRGLAQILIRKVQS